MVELKNWQKSILELKFELDPLLKPRVHLVLDPFPDVLLGELLGAPLAAEDQGLVVEQENLDLPAVADEIAEFLRFLDALAPEGGQLFEILDDESLSVGEDVG